jgi:hypothetical protein
MGARGWDRILSRVGKTYYPSAASLNFKRVLKGGPRRKSVSRAFFAFEFSETGAVELSQVGEEEKTPAG